MNHVVVVVEAAVVQDDTSWGTAPTLHTDDADDGSSDVSLVVEVRMDCIDEDDAEAASDADDNDADAEEVRDNHDRRRHTRTEVEEEGTVYLEDMVVDRDRRCRQLLVGSDAVEWLSFVMVTVLLAAFSDLLGVAVVAPLERRCCCCCF